MLLLDRAKLLMEDNRAVLVEHALGSGSLAAIDQYLRLIEDQLANLEDVAAAVSHEVRRLERRLEEHQQKAASFDRAVDAFLIDGSETAAAASQSRLNSLQQLIETYAQKIGQHQQDLQQMSEAMNALEGQHAALKATRAEVQTLLAAVAGSQPGGPAAGASLAELMSAENEDVRVLAQQLAAQLRSAEQAVRPYPLDLGERIELVLGRKGVEAQLSRRRAGLALRT